MSVYNSNIQTRLIDPVFDRKNFRAEYRLNADTVYLSNMRLLDQGVHSTADTPANKLLGIWGIKSIALFDGSELLDQLLESSIYKAFKNFNTTNDSALSVEKQLSRTNWGFLTASEQAWDGATPTPTDQKIDSLNDWTLDPSATTTGQNLTWLSLKSVLPFLASSLYVPTSVYKNLRLVIQWKSPSELKSVGQDSTMTYETIVGSFLAVDEVVKGDGRDSIIKNYQGVVYRAVEHDSVTVNAVDPSAGSKETQSNRFLVNGYNNKTVERMLVVQTPTDATTWRAGTDNVGAADQGSLAQLNNQFQFRVNGQNKLPRSGFTRKNQRLAALTDTYGECCMPTTGNFVYVPNMGNFTPDPTKNKEFGQTDYTAIEIREPVRELVIEYNRDGVAGNTDINQSLRLNLFAEVTKSVRVDNGRYIVSYL